MAVSGGSDIAQLAAGWAAIPEQSVINMVGALQQSTPLGQLFQSFGSDAVKDVNRAMIQGLALGLAPRETARTVRSALNISRARAETIVRTETLRASREAMDAAFQESGVVKGWRWSAAISERTCIFCLSMHGSIHKLGEPLASHPACRCSKSPWIGNGDDAPWESGESWLRRQPQATRRSILGTAAEVAFTAGEVVLTDFQRIGFDDAWGAWGAAGSLQHAIKQARRR
jgi:SPP1 gp7 family putative phage head morphogenesis protein